VDLQESLARGRENFLNSLPTNDHRFIADDVLRCCTARPQGRKIRYDRSRPPTFSRSHRGKPFHVERDFEHMLTSD
jgi:23S rRNA G2069 N7-methylase RlmK/C1962 C5-methylase RlmI